MNNDNKILTLLDLIKYFSHKTRPDSDIRIYDMGRRIQPIEEKTFNSFEMNQLAWPYPLMQNAWFAISFELDENPENVTIWFLKFPLDEQGKLVQAARDEYIAQFIHKVEQKLTYPEMIQQTQQESPYGFKPSEEKLANIHAIIKSHYGLESRHIDTVKNYLVDEQHYSQWESLAFQGIADYCSDMQKNAELEAIFVQSCKKLPMAVITAFSHCLEHHRLSDQVFHGFSKLYKQQSSLNVMLCCLHGLSHENLNTDQEKILDDLLFKALNSDYKSDIELLAVIAGRCWSRLKNNKLIALYLEALAANQSDQDAFKILIRDLLFIPGMRDAILTEFRNPVRSDNLSKAIGEFYCVSTDTSS